MVGRIQSSAICDAIRLARRLKFVHKGLERVVEPYCHGISTEDNEVLRAIQVRGSSSRGAKGFHFGKLWGVREMSQLQVLAETFTPDDPNYNPNDSAMKEIHCRIELPTKPGKK